MLRKIAPLADLKFKPAAPLEGGYDDDGVAEPTIEWGDPRELSVDDRYQRPVTEKGRGLIRRIAEGTFSWRKYCLPIVTINPDGIKVVVDGQHTLIAAATRGLTNVPWLLVPSISLADEAEAFVGLNKSRTSITAMVEHKARVTAGDPDALAVERVCKAVGVNLCLVQARTWAPRDTIALGSIRGIVRKRGMEGARRILGHLANAELAPISADHIKAVDCLLFGDEFVGKIDESKLTAAFTGAAGATLMADAATFMAMHRVRMWQALTAVTFKAAGKRRAAA